MQDIEPKLDYNNSPITPLPPCDSLALAERLPTFFVNVFICVIVVIASHFEKYFDVSYIIAFEEEHVTSQDTSNKEKSFCTMLDAIDSKTGFCEACSLVHNCFPKLCEFAGGLASMYPGTAQVESAFFIIDWEKDKYRTSLMDVSLVGIMHAKQFKDLVALSTT